MPPSRIPRRELLALGHGVAASSRPRWPRREERAPRTAHPIRPSAPNCRPSWASCRTGIARFGKEKVGEEERDGYILERWVFDLNGIEPVPAFVARPRTSTGRAPAVLFNHSHGGRLHDRQEGVRGRPQLPAADAVCEGTDRSRLRRALHRPLGVRRAQPQHRGRHLQGHALAGAGALGHDGLRQPAGARRACRPARTWIRHVSRRSACRWAAPWRGGWPRSTSG